MLVRHCNAIAAVIENLCNSCSNSYIEHQCNIVDMQGRDITVDYAVSK